MIKDMEKIKELFIKYKEVILYIFFGGVTTVVNIVTYWLCTRLLSISVLPSNIIANVLAILIAYITNKIWVFESETRTFKEFLREISAFFLARGITLLMDLGIVEVGVELLHFPDMLIKIFSTVLVIILNYVFSKLFIFNRK